MVPYLDGPHEFRLDGEDDVIFVLIHAIVLSAGISFHRNVPFNLRLCSAKLVAIFFVVGVYDKPDDYCSQGSVKCRIWFPWAGF